MLETNILIIGGGGREHALAWSISRSEIAGKLFIAPGNPGTAQLGENVILDISDFKAVADFCRLMNIGLVVVGPEQPLVDGITDFLKEQYIPVFGPSKYAAQLEGSKSFAKHIMKKYDIPTAGYHTFSLSDKSAIQDFISSSESFPMVLKADGLAGGKGVFIPESKVEALANLESIYENKGLKSAAETLVIEEFMEGEEASVFAICDGEKFVTLTAAQDHKRIGEGDTGPNTGGMGAYTPAPIVDKSMMNVVAEKIIKPTLDGMKSEGAPYVGVLYVGLMITSAGPKVVEYNCRFGDPECQIILPKLQTDLFPLLMKAAKNNLDETQLEFNDGFYTCVVMSSEGYPETSTKGIEINGLSDAEEQNLIFHAGTKQEIPGKIVTNGGRVLAVVGKGNTLRSSIEDSYHGVQKITFQGAYYRRDIGKKGLAHLE